MGPNGWTFLILTGVFLPFVAIRFALRLRASGRTPTAVQHLLSVVVSQGFLLVMALMAARYENIWLFPAPAFRLAPAAGAILFLAVSIGTIPMRWSWKSLEEKRRGMWLYPRSGADLGRWALVALIAGVVEEIVFRGVMFQLLYRLFVQSFAPWPAWGIAVAICVIVFSLAHFVQGARTMVVIALLSVGMHLLVWVSGDLYTAMIVHAVYDFMAGIVIMRLARSEGLLASPASVSAS